MSKQAVSKDSELFYCHARECGVSMDDCFKISSSKAYNRPHCFKENCSSPERVCLSCVTYDEVDKESTVVPGERLCKYHLEYGYKIRKDDDPESAQKARQQEIATLQSRVDLRREHQKSKGKRGRRKKTKDVTPEPEVVVEPQPPETLNDEDLVLPSEASEPPTENSSGAATEQSKQTDASSLVGKVFESIREQVVIDNEVHEIPLDRILLDDEQPRDNVSDKDVEELADTIRVVGQLEAGTVIPVPNKPGMYRLKAGEHRYKACKLAGEKTFKARILHSDDPDIQLLVAAVSNLASVPYKEVEIAKIIYELRSRFGWSVKQAARVLKMTEETAYGYLKILQVDPRCYDYVGEHLPRGKRITLGIVKLLALLPQEVHLRHVEHIIEKGMMTPAATKYLEGVAKELGIDLPTRKQKPSNVHQSLTRYINRAEERAQDFLSRSVKRAFVGRTEADKKVARHKLETLINNLQQIRDQI